MCIRREWGSEFLWEWILDRDSIESIGRMIWIPKHKLRSVPTLKRQNGQAYYLALRSPSPTTCFVCILKPYNFVIITIINQKGEWWKEEIEFAAKNNTSKSISKLCRRGLPKCEEFFMMWKNMSYVSQKRKCDPRRFVFSSRTIILTSLLNRMTNQFVELTHEPMSFPEFAIWFGVHPIGGTPPIKNLLAPSSYKS